ncbi:hypothetical protein MRX96_058202 [Rhipicephalus microplus]
MAAAVSTKAALLLALFCAQSCGRLRGAVDAAIDTTFNGHHLLSVRIESKADLKTLLDVKDNLDIRSEGFAFVRVLAQRKHRVAAGLDCEETVR